MKGFFKRLNDRRLTLDEQGVFAERLAMLLGASLSLPESVGLLEKSFGERRIVAFRMLRKSLEDGIDFETALTASSLGFRRPIILSARIGERSGALAETLIAAEDQIARRRKAAKGMLSAAAYPAMILVAAVGIIGFLVFFIMPKIMPTLLGLNIPLPLITRVFIAISRGIAKDWWRYLIIAGSVAGFGTLAYAKWPAARGFFHAAILRAPFFGVAAQNSALANILDTLAVLTGSGCSLDESLSEASLSANLIPYREALARSAESVKKGKSLSAAWKGRPELFPSLVVEGAAVGERSGNLEVILAKLADYHARELESALSISARIIEPAMMIGVGVIVAAAALSIVMPIYSISEHISG